MASFKQLPSGNWRAQVKKNGIRASEVFPSKARAEAWAISKEAEIVAGIRGEIPDKTFGELMERYGREVSVTKKGERWEAIRIGQILRDELAKVKLEWLNETHAAAWRDRRLATVSPDTVRREWNLYSNACTIAIREWKWLRENPFKLVRRPQASPARDRLFSCLEIEALLAALGWDDGVRPDTVSAMVGHALLFALETGMRCGELCALTWGNLGPTVAEVRKGKTRAATRRVPLSPYARELIATLDEGKPTDLVFGIKESQVDALFRKAKARCGIEDLHFHDSRATAITRLAKKLDILDLARMIGHRDLKQLQVYYRESAEEIAGKL